MSEITVPQPAGSEAKPAPVYEDLAQAIEFPLNAPQNTETDVAQGCELAKRYGIASVLVRPCDVELVARWLGGSSVALCASLDMPHGELTTAAKAYAARDLLRRGAKEIETAMNTGKLISRQFQYLEIELLQMAEACHQAGAILKVALETQYLNEELQIVACRIAKRAGADFLAAPTLPDITLLKTYARDRTKLKACAAPPDLDSVLAFQQAGCVRIECAQMAAVLDAWKTKLAEAETATT